MAIVSDLSGNSPIGFAEEDHIDDPDVGSGGGGGGGDASAANQLLELSELEDIADAVQSTDPVAVFLDGLENETVAASQTAQILGATGAVGDRLNFLLVVPATTSPGAIAIKDGDGSDITVFTGGASSVSNLVPFIIEWGKECVNATTPGWKITTGANVSVVAFGDFT
jgi:hypothetical protein